MILVVPSDVSTWSWWPTSDQWRFRLVFSGLVFLVSDVLSYLFLSDDTLSSAEPPNWLSSIGLGLAGAGLCWLLLQSSRRAQPAKPVIRPRLGFVDPV